MKLVAPVLQRYAETPTVMPSVETDPVEASDDAADDPAVLAGNGPTWILGADKRAGLRVYDLEGNQQAFLPTGRLNNVDALPAGKNRFIAAASNRTTIAVDLFTVTTDPLTVEHNTSFPLDFTDPYGLCMGVVDGVSHVFVGDKEGNVEAWKLDNMLAAERVFRIEFDTQTEGCVFDSLSETLYVGEETAGVWAVDLETHERELLHAVDGETLVADVEGMDIYQGDKTRYLVVSSQGDDSFVVYDLPGYKKLLKFRIVANRDKGIDGASETDGLSVTAHPLPSYPQGILVVQDGYNVAPGENQNFKIVDWGQVEALIEHE